MQHRDAEHEHRAPQHSSALDYLSKVQLAHGFCLPVGRKDRWNEAVCGCSTVAPSTVAPKPMAPPTATPR